MVWNRSVARAEALADQGADCISEVSSAISESPVTIVCIDNYEATNSILKTPEVEASLKDRILIQLSTGTPTEARAMCEWANSVGAEYLDGAIMAFPGQMGNDQAFIIVSGDRKTYEKVELILKLLAPATRYVGDDPSSADLLDHALLSVMLGAFVGVVSGTALCEAGGMSLTDYRELLNPFMDFVAGSVLFTVQKISDNDLQRAAGNDLHGMTEALEHIIKSSNETGISSEVPAFVKTLLDRAEDRGLAEYDSAALIEVLRA